MHDQFCQSCGMPICTDDLWGTETTGAVSGEYCRYCYQGGQFTQPNVTMPEMIEICVPFMTEKGMEEKQARNLLNECLPKLKRWHQD